MEKTYHIMTNSPYIGERPHLIKMVTSKVPKLKHFTPGYSKEKGPYRTQDYFPMTLPLKPKNGNWN